MNEHWNGQISSISWQDNKMLRQAQSHHSGPVWPDGNFIFQYLAIDYGDHLPSTYLKNCQYSILPNTNQASKILPNKSLPKRRNFAQSGHTVRGNKLKRHPIIALAGLHPTRHLDLGPILWRKFTLLIVFSNKFNNLQFLFIWAAPS